MIRAWTGLVLAASWALAAAPAAGQASNYDYDRCENRGGAFSFDDQVAGCTAVIEAPGEIVSNIAVSYSNRGNAYAARQDFARALARAALDDLAGAEPISTTRFASSRNDGKPGGSAAKSACAVATIPAPRPISTRRSASCRSLRTPLPRRCSPFAPRPC